MSTKEEIKNRLLSWSTNENYFLENDLYVYFEKDGKWVWCEIADEVLKLQNEMFDEEIEDDSPQDMLITAALAQAADGVYCALSAALGLNKKALQFTIDQWYENKDNLPPPVSIEQFLKLYEEQKEECKKLNLI